MQTEYPHNAPWPPAQQQHPVMPPQPPTPQPGVVWLPPVANDRSNLRWMSSVLFLWALFIGFMKISSYPQTFFSSLAGWGAILFDLITFPGLIFVFGIITFVQARRWDVINQHRKQAAAYGFASGIPLAEPQPFPNIEALPLPFTIKLKTNWGLVTSLFCLFIGLLFFLQLNGYSQRGWSFQQSLAHITNNWPFFVVPPLGILAFCVWIALPQSIEVTAQGLVVRHPMHDWFKTASGPFWKWVIPWSDARLFAIRDGKSGSSKVRYELSSPFKVVTLSRIVRPRWWSLYRPAQPFGEYNTQMDALLALISARTGLLLYDVR
ncbi:MAG TPA: hypothetical protein VFU32_01370 [Ktedonobacterales bacterium]|nr:hypothetical protein [Ktedonobacterales bacterium]